MAQPLTVQFEVPDDVARFRLPDAVDQRLQHLLSKQGRGDALTTAEHAEAQGLVDMAELLTLLRLRTERAARDAALPG